MKFGKEAYVIRKSDGVVGLLVQWGGEYYAFCHNQKARNQWTASAHGHMESSDAVLERGYKYGWNYHASEAFNLFEIALMENV